MSGYLTHLITGGTRSGKSYFALKLAAKSSRPFYVATGWADDTEMEERIKRHKAERGEKWTTIESKIDMVGALKKAEAAGADFIVADCLTLWVSNLMMDETCDISAEADKLAAYLKNGLRTPAVFVTNEVGSGVVPVEKMGRDFRDLAGMVNRKIAEAVECVILTVCGMPMVVKPSRNQEI